MTNETMIEALEYGFIILNNNLANFGYISCVGMECDNCKFYISQTISCGIGYNEVSEENLEFLEENYPEHLLKV